MPFRSFKQARLRSANMLRPHGQEEQCMFAFLYTPNYPHGTQLCFVLISKMLSKAIRLFSKIQNILKTNRPTDRQTDR